MELQEDFNEKKAEIEEYIQLLENVDRTLHEGTIFLTARREHNAATQDDKSKEFAITPSQQKIMFSCLYLQLYNLVESTVIGCISALEQTVQKIDTSSWLKLNDFLRQEIIRSWVKQKGAEQGHNQAILNLVDSMFQEKGLLVFYLDKRGNGGNWDDNEILTFAQKIGMKFVVDSELQTKIKKHFYNSLGGLSLIKKFRNELAHGEVSFVQCGERLDLNNLQSLAQIVFEYLQVVINRIQTFIDKQEYFSCCNTSSCETNNRTP